jgi:hypothetical protein
VKLPGREARGHKGAPAQRKKPGTPPCSGVTVNDHPLEERRLPMPRVNLVDPATATGAAKPVFDEIKSALFKAVANSPAALKDMWGARARRGED